MKHGQSVDGYRQRINNQRPGYRIAAAAVDPDLLVPLLNNGAWLPSVDLADAVAHGVVPPHTVVQEECGHQRGRYFRVEQGRLTQCDYAGKLIPDGRVLLLTTTKAGAPARGFSA